MWLAWKKAKETDKRYKKRRKRGQGKKIVLSPGVHSFFIFNSSTVISFFNWINIIEKDIISVQIKYWQGG